MVETAPPCTGAMDQHPVKDLASALVSIEPLVEKMAQEPSRLRDPEGDPLVGREGTAVVVLSVGHHVPDGHKPEADDGGTLNPVDELVDFAGLKASGHVNVRLVWDDLSICLACEPPAVAWDDASWGETAVALGEHVIWVHGLNHGIG